MPKLDAVPTGHSTPLKVKLCAPRPSKWSLLSPNVILLPIYCHEDAKLEPNYSKQLLPSLLRARFCAASEYIVSAYTLPQRCEIE